MPDDLSQRLLAQYQPEPERLRTYKQEMQAMLATNEQRLRREKWGMIALWIFALGFMITVLLITGLRGLMPPGIWLAFFGSVFLLAGAVEVVKHFINRSRVEVLKDLKSLELRVLELQEQVRGASR